MDKSSEPIAHFVFSRLERGEEGQEAVQFKAGALDALRDRLRATPPGKPMVNAVRELAYVCRFLSEEKDSPTAAEELADLIESFAGTELKHVGVRKVTATEDKVQELSKQFEQFQGSQGEKLPDSGERLDLKPFKGPIRG